MKHELEEDDISLVAGSVAFYAFLAVFPALAALVSIYGLVADPADVGRQVDAMGAILPSEARTAIQEELAHLASQSSGSLGVSGILSVLLALWSANKGTKALLSALNIAFDEDESRGFIKLNAISLLLTTGALVLAVLAIAGVIALPALLGHLGLSAVGAFLVRWLRWPLLGAMVLAGLATLYRYGPARAKAKWRWVTPGSLLAAGLWLGGSALFSWYVSSFGKYDKVYGSVGVIIIVLTWFLLSAYAVILGAELNAELERQTTADTTSGPPRPLGQRGAYAADTVGGTP